MADLAKTITEWRAFFREFSLFLKVMKDLDFSRRRYELVRNLIVEEFEQDGKLGTWSLAGVKLGVNTDDAGILYGKLLDNNPGAGQAKVELYSDSARAVKVAEGSAADGAVITLAEVSSSGLTGSVTLGTPISADDLDLRLLVVQDYLGQTDDVFPLTSPEAQKSLQAFIELVGDTLDALNSEFSSARGEAQTSFIRTRMKEFLETTQSAVIDVSEDVDEDNNVTVTRTGILAELVDAMLDDSVDQPYTVPNTQAVTATVADIENVGVGVLTKTFNETYSYNGRVTLVCTDETIGSEKFSVTLIEDGTNRVIEAANSLIVKASFVSSDLGLSASLARTIAESNDGGNQLSAYVINGETDSNTDNGVLYLDLYDTAGTRTVDVYSDAARTELVATGSLLGDGTITLNEANVSGLTGSVAVVYASDDGDIEIDLQVFKIGDEFRFSMTNDEAGVIATLVGRAWKISLPTGVAGVNRIPDGFVSEGLDLLIRDHSA